MARAATPEASMTQSIRRAAAALALSAGAACVSLPPERPVEAFRIGEAAAASPGAPSAPRPAARAVVALEDPLAQGLLGSDRIIAVVDGSLRPVAGARWDETIPAMLRRQMARALQTGGAVDVVDAAQRAGSAGYGLVTVVEAMQAEIRPDFTAEAVATIGARLVRFPGRDVVATRVFSARETAPDDAAASLSRAIDAAAGRATADLAAWVAATTAASPRAAGS
jgi:ABC-type uncharacterized transport system auxiliary subunit